MRNCVISAFMSALAVLLLAGCGEPTAEGLKNRVDARERMNVMGAQIHFDQARQCFGAGQFDKALHEINQAIEANHKSAEYDLLQGRIYLETHRLEPALVSFNSAQEKNPLLAEASYFIGIVYQRWSDDDLAYKNYAKAFEMEPTNAQYLLASAESLIALGEFDQAKQLIEPKMDHFEHNAALRQILGQIALLQGEPKIAAALYGEARLLNPDDDMLLEQLMWSQYAAEMYGQCQESVKRLESRSKEKRSDLIHLEARCLTMMNRGSEARELYIALSHMRSADPVIWSELGTLAWDLGDYHNVALCSVQMIALAPERYEGYMLKGINEKHKGNLADASKLFREAAQRAPDVALPHLLLGQTLAQGGNLDGARLAYNAAVTAEPASTEAKELLRRLNDGQRLSAAPTD